MDASKAVSQLDSLTEACFTLVPTTLLDQCTRSVLGGRAVKAAKRRRRTPSTASRRQTDEPQLPENQAALAAQHPALGDLLRAPSTAVVAAAPRPTADGANERRAQHAAQWTATKNLAERVLLQTNEHFFQGLRAFVARAHEPLAFLDHPAYRTGFSPQELPTAIVFAGMNQLDHAPLFAQLVAQLRSDDLQCVCTLSSRDAPNLRRMLARMTQQLMRGDFFEELCDEGIEEESDNGAVDIVRRKGGEFAEDAPETGQSLADALAAGPSKAAVPAFDLRLVTAWYRDGPARAARAGGRAAPKVVVLLEDFEQMDAGVVAAFVTALHAVVDRVPFVLVVSLATSLEALHQALPKRVFSWLQIERFRLRNHLEALDHLVGAVLVDAPADALRLGAAAYGQLLGAFQCDHLSVHRFLQALHYAHVHHFCGSSLSSLVANRTTCTESMLGAQLLGCPSLQRTLAAHVQQLSAPGWAAAGLRDELKELAAFLGGSLAMQKKIAVEKLLPRALRRLDGYHARVSGVLPCVIQLQHVLKSAAFRRPLRTLYDAVLAGTFARSSHFARLFCAAGELTPLDALALLRSCRESLLRAAARSDAGCEAVRADRAAVELFVAAIEAVFASGSDSDDDTTENTLPLQWDELGLYGARSSPAAADAEKLEAVLQLDENGIPIDKGDEDIDYYYKLTEKRVLDAAVPGVVSVDGGAATRRALKSVSGTQKGIIDAADALPEVPRLFSAMEHDMSAGPPPDLVSLRDTLQGAVAKLDYKAVRTQLVAWLKRLFTDALQPPDTLLFCEIHYYDREGTLTNAFAADPRRSVALALGAPFGSYLPRGAAGVDADSELNGISPALPDTALAYKLHEQCGSMINLRDWLSAFYAALDGAALVQPSPPPKRRRGAAKDAPAASEDAEDAAPPVPPPLIHARFIQAVRELEFLGLVKMTQRKADHALRLTWGLGV